MTYDPRLTPNSERSRIRDTGILVIVMSSSLFVAVVIYDPIPGHDRFGQLIIENLKQAGIAGGRGGSD